MVVWPAILISVLLIFVGMPGIALGTLGVALIAELFNP